MSKLFAYAIVLGSIAGLGVVAGAGCVSNDDPSTDSTSALLTPLAADAGDAGSGPVLGSVVISQLYGGGGSDGATFDHDFVEIFNRTAKAITLDGMSLQLSSTPTSSFTHAIPLTGSLPAGAYLLVQLGTQDATVGTDLSATPDLTDDMSLGTPTDGKAAIAITTSALNCGATGNLCAATKLMDLVGYGAASQQEGLQTAPALDSTHADQRKAAGCTDSNGNSFDFTSVTPPAPRNSSTTASPCPVLVKDAGTLPDGAPAPPVTDPVLGPESAFDAGYHPEAGAQLQSGGGDGGCSVGTVGEAGQLYGAFAGLGLVAAAVLRRRRARG